MRVIRVALAVVVIAGLAAVVAGCGSKKKTSSGSVPTTAPQGAKKGGTITLLTNGDVDDKLDPGYSYYQLDFIYDYPTQRPVLSYKPSDTTKASPDLAASDPTVSSDGKTITIKLRHGVKFSPPVNREVTSADVKYAIERDFLPQVANGYASAYWGNLEGLAPYQSGKAKEITGLQTPDKYTLIMKLTKPTAAVAVAALALPGSAPVPKEYAQKYDQGKISSYGQHVVATGPYMVKNDASGKVTGYTPGKSIVFVRNPNWDRKTDFRPAYLDGFTFNEGNDPAVGNRKVVQGSGLIGNPTDMPPPPAFLKQHQNDPTHVVPGFFSGRVRYIALDTQKPPFNNINLRKAVGAAMNRSAMVLAFGGAGSGVVATHILTPGEIGFDLAGGLKGPAGDDWLANPSGNMALAKKYMQKAGFPSGKYNGPQITMVADNSTNFKAAAEIALNGLQSLGFKVSFRPVTHDTMYSKFCSVPKSQPEVCPSVGWLKDFPDPQSMLDPTFNGKNIIPANNSNWPQLNDPTINKAMDKAEVLINPSQREKAWADIDKMITATAAIVPWMWDKPPLIKSANVNAVVNKANAAVDFSYSSVK